MGWSFLILLAAFNWYAPAPHRRLLWHADTLRGAVGIVQRDFVAWWQLAGTADRIAFFASFLLMIVAVFLLPYFVILPFGARPGPNKPCIRHVARTVLLGSGMMHWWGAAFVGLFLVYAARGVSSIVTDYAQALSPVLLIFALLSMWTIGVLIVAVRREYRGPQDFPEPHDPWCDDCGYILSGIDPAGRCPECGRPIVDSLGPDIRPPTPWDRRPRFTNVRLVAAQLWAIARRPRTLFFSMPTLSGQAAAQRRLLGSVLVLFLLALPIVPLLYVLLDAEWNWAVVPSSLAMALTWAVFGLMMVGIETTGIATFSRFRGQRIYLATSAKITAYSAILMIPWIILGGGQLIAYTCISVLHAGGIRSLFQVGLRGEQVILAISLIVAHIGGLIWYELTVYRGLCAIQYANK